MITDFMSIYLPTLDQQDRLVPNREMMLDWLLCQMSGRFGGATALPARGAWSTSSGLLVVEPIAIVKSYCPSTCGHENWMVELARQLKDMADQDSVAIETPEGMNFV